MTVNTQTNKSGILGQIIRRAVVTWGVSVVFEKYFGGESGLAANPGAANPGVPYKIYADQAQKLQNKYHHTRIIPK